MGDTELGRDSKGGEQRGVFLMLIGASTSDSGGDLQGPWSGLFRVGVAMSCSQDFKKT